MNRDRNRQAFDDQDLIQDFSLTAAPTPSLIDEGRHLAYSGTNYQRSNHIAAPRFIDSYMDTHTELTTARHGMQSPSEPTDSVLDHRAIAPNGRSQPSDIGSQALLVNSTANTFEYLNHQPAQSNDRSIGMLYRHAPSLWQSALAHPTLPPNGNNDRMLLPLHRHVMPQEGNGASPGTHGNSRYEPVLRVPMNSVPSCIRYRLLGDI
ncbi:MAG TPA: hypothetical protein V6C72_10150 [Chroococcales cyanobacterium]